MISRRDPLRRLARIAQASRPISRPAKGRIGHSPRDVKNSATPNVTMARLPTRIRAFCEFSEQLGASSMRHSGSCGGGRCEATTIVARHDDGSGQCNGEPPARQRDSWIGRVLAVQPAASRWTMRAMAARARTVSKSGASRAASAAAPAAGISARGGPPAVVRGSGGWPRAVRSRGRSGCRSSRGTGDRPERRSPRA